MTEIESLELRHGDAQNLELIQIINKSPIPVNLNQYVWDIPANATTDNTYVLIARDSFGYSYSSKYCQLLMVVHGFWTLDFNIAYFTIIGSGNNNTTSTSTNTVAASTEPSEQASSQSLVARNYAYVDSSAVSMRTSTIAFAIAIGSTLFLM